MISLFEIMLDIIKKAKHTHSDVGENKMKVCYANRRTPIYLGKRNMFFKKHISLQLKRAYFPSTRVEMAGLFYL